MMDHSRVKRTDLLCIVGDGSMYIAGAEEIISAWCIGYVGGAELLCPNTCGHFGQNAGVLVSLPAQQN